MGKKFYTVKKTYYTLGGRVNETFKHFHKESNAKNYIEERAEGYKQCGFRVEEERSYDKHYLTMTDAYATHVGFDLTSSTFED